MAKRTVIELIDDLSGESLTDGSGRTVTFSLDGANYEIDLSDANVEELQAAMRPFVAVARRVSGRAGTGRVANRSNARAGENAAIREWASSNGYRVGARGRISDEIRAAFAAR